MFANERYKKISDLIKSNGSVTTNELMDEFSVSIETVRRDLLSMEKQGLLQRVHGGAVATGQMMPYHGLAERMKENSPKKEELARIDASYVNNGDIISMDSGSTPIYFAKALKARLSSVTVVTNSLDVLNELGGYKDFKVIGTGGNYNNDENCFYGSLAIDTINRIRVQKAFIFPVAISLSGGICNHTSDFVLLQREMIRSSDSVFVLADSSKFEKSDLFKQSEMLESYTYITDSGLSPSLQAMYRENNINIVKPCFDEL